MTITVSLCASHYNTGLGVYILPLLGDCSWPMLIGCNDNNVLCEDTVHSQLTFEASANMKYLFDVHGADLASGIFMIGVTGVNHVLADSCPGVTIASLPYQRLGDTRCSVNNYSNCVGPLSQDEMYNFTATQDQVLIASLCGSSYDTGLEVRTDGECPGDSMVVCDDDYGCLDPLNSIVAFQANVGRTYYIIVHGWANSAGVYRLDVYEQPKPEQLVIKPSPPMIQLWWRHVEGAIVYHVYRDSIANIVPSPLNLIGNPTDTMFVDSEALMLPGLRYFYVVAAEIGPAFGSPVPDKAEGTDKRWRSGSRGHLRRPSVLSEGGLPSLLISHTNALTPTRLDRCRKSPTRK